MKNSFDLIVIGAGSGGLAAAKRASLHGAKVAIVEGDRVGGTCVIKGCVPKKLLLFGSLYKEYIDNAFAYGVKFKDAYIDTTILLSNVRSEVDRLNLLHIELLERSGVSIINGWASFIDRNNILVRENENDISGIKLNGKRILIAVGGAPNRLAIPGAELAWVSDDIFLLKKLPENILIVGAGFIACEFSCILNALGVKVKQLVRGDRLLRGFDKELSDLLAQNMKQNGIELNFGKYPISIEGSSGMLQVKTNTHDSKIFGGVLFAIGRSPCLNRLKLPFAGVKYQDERVIVDEHQATNIPNIYAVGDVSNSINLTPVAIDEGRAFADTIFGDKPRKVNYDLVSSAVFSQPEIASVGHSEQKAIELYGNENIICYRSKFRSMANALSKRGVPCLLKLIVEKKSDKLIGCHMVGDHASEIIQMAAIALGMGASKSEFDATMALHPTIAEEFVTMV